MSGKRTLKRSRLILALILAPGVAGLVGGALVMLGTLPLVFADGFETGAESAILNGVIMATILAMLVGILFCYVIGSPFIIAGWMVAHFLTKRRTEDFLVLLAIAGTLFSLSLFHGFLSRLSPSSTIAEVRHTVSPFVSGAVAGLCVGWLISKMGYEKTANE